MNQLMKAWVLHNINQFYLETIPIPQLRKKEVLVSVKAAGICGSDIPRIYQTGTYSYPLIPGHECSGIVEKLGEQADKKWQGKRVGIFPLIPCMTCIFCQKKQYELCRNYSYLGSRRNGGFAEYIAVPEDNLIELPEQISNREAAILEPMAVAVHAIRRTLLSIKNPAAENLSNNNTIPNYIVIYGLGTIGMSILLFLINENNNNKFQKIIAVGNKELQKQTVLKIGLPKECYCDSQKEDVKQWILERTEGRGADIVFECIGKNLSIAQAVAVAAPLGRVCLVGNPYTDIRLEKAIYGRILRNQLIITGIWNSFFTHQLEDDWHYVIEQIIQKKVKPDLLISHQFKLEELEKGIQIIREKSQDYLKIIMNN